MDKTFQGLVVYESPYGETGKILTVLTEEMGTVKVLATGGRTLKSSYITSAQLFAYSTLTVSVNEKGDYMVLKEARLIESFYFIRRDLNALAFCSYACEMAKITAVPNDNSTLRLILNTLYAAQKEVAPIPIIKAVFELKLCCVGGLMPEIEPICGECGEKADGYSLENWIPVCKKHIGNKQKFIPLCAAAFKAIEYICSADFSKMLAFRTSPDAAADLCVFAEAYTVASFEFNPKTLQFYNDISRK